MGRVLGIDYGDTRIGLALSDPLHVIASPYKTLIVRDEKQILEEIELIVADNDVELLVVGLPLGMKGQETDQTRRVRKFASLLKSTGYEVTFEDERLTSVSAKRSLVMQEIKTGHNKGLVDQTAAAILLQQYLDKKSG
ncbi:MAG: Holliday junction resolvase RuvX [FCB group bacterium]|nr:Holliday junction resolvase RuvX [FCB group bacterium]